jgi:hypothetical protein
LAEASRARYFYVLAAILLILDPFGVNTSGGAFISPQNFDVANEKIPQR